MLGTGIDIIQPQIRNLLPLLDKKPTTAVVKRNKKSGLNRSDRQTWSCLQRTLLIRKDSIKYCLLLWWLAWRFLASHEYVVYEIMSVYKCLKQQTDGLYIIICNCIYSVVMNCGWNNNVAVKTVACWNWNIFTSSSWLDRQGEFVFTTR